MDDLTIFDLYQQTNNKTIDSFSNKIDSIKFY